MLAFDDSLPMMMYRALDAVMPVYRDLFARHNLTEQQWRVLRVIWTSKNVTSATLSQRTLLSPQSLVSIVDRLEKKELVTRIRSVDDRRQVFVVATAAGRKLQDEVTPQVVEIQDVVRASISETDWNELDRILSSIKDGVSVKPNDFTANNGMNRRLQSK